MNDSYPTRIVITAGATQEPLDEVRFLGNRSSGKLGTLIAFAAADFGYEVNLLHGIGCISPSSHPRLHSTPFTSSRDLAAKLDELWHSHSILIMAAAVSDYTPRGGQAQGKLKRCDDIAVELTPTQDIVASLASHSRDDQRIIAFALEEAESLEQSAREKLVSKHVDAIIDFKHLPVFNTAQDARLRDGRQRGIDGMDRAASQVNRTASDVDDVDWAQIQIDTVDCRDDLIRKIVGGFLTR